jgi:ribosomal protein L13E
MGDWCGTLKEREAGLGGEPGGCVSAGVDWRDARFVGTLPPDHRRGEEVRRVEHRVDWNAEFVHGDLGKAVQQLKQESARDCSWEA